jgi:O-antigen ligase
MGLITRLCFFVCAIGLIIGIGNSQNRFRQTIWAMSLTGLAVATYAFAQFFGKDPFLPSELYTFESAAGPVVRVLGTLGHANYLGNFLLYTAPLNMAIAAATESRLRSLALIALAVSIAAIVFSGTRGAALGLIVGASVFLAFEFRPAQISFNRRTLLSAAAAIAIIFASILMISVNPASRSIAARAINVIREGASGAGRALLWRASIKMVPDFAIVGCGPEGFRKAFLEYKSKELAQLAPKTNNESSHNSYLDAAISYGLPGAIFYVAIIASSFALLIRARRRALDKNARTIITGLLAALAAVAAHNFFIFDQISTGLYFFAIIALAQVATAEARDESVSHNFRWPSLAGVALVGVALIGVALWYAIALIKADIEINKSFQAASAGNYDNAEAYGKKAVSSPEMTGSYNFQYARIMTFYADLLQSAPNSANRSAGEIAKMKAAQTAAINVAVTQATKSLAHTLTPDSNRQLLAYLALISGNATGLRVHAAESVKWDQYSPSAHWLMSEAFLAVGDRQQAEREAKFALEINPNQQEARAALMRAQGIKDPREQTVEELLASARELRNQGKTKKTLKNLLIAIQMSQGKCADCRFALASVYEAMELYDKAITEWQLFIEQSPDAAARQQAKSRIESLKQKSSANK